MILITGCNGMLGSYIDFGVKTDRNSLDVTNLDQVKAVFQKHGPKVVLHLAALTDMKICESDPSLSYMVNSAGAYNVALAAKEAGAKVIYVSTNAVFDGTKDSPYLPTDRPRPVNIYGHSKYLGELAVLGISAKNLIVRTSWIFGGGKEKDKKFIGKILPKLIANEPIQAIDDVYGTPTYGKDLSAKLKELAKIEVAGIVHVANSGKASRLDMAEKMKGVINSKSVLTGAPISSFAGLSNTLRNETLDSGEHAMRSWSLALEEYVKTEWII